MLDIGWVKGCDGFFRATAYANHYQIEFEIENCVFFLERYHWEGEEI